MVNIDIYKQYDIKLVTQEDQIEFSEICSKYPFDINLCKGSYQVDAKSILGIGTIDTTEGCFATICSNMDDGIIDKFERDIDKYII